MTRVVYVVLSHRDWPQVRRLSHAILGSSPDARVIVMHDSRSERFPPRDDDERIEIVDHGLACDWGSWELVEAALRGFAIARDRHDAQLVALISGQDYPTRPLGAWEDEALSARSWIGEARPLAYEPHWGRRYGEGDDRLTRYSYRWFRSPVEFLRPQMPGWARLPRPVNGFWVRARRALTLRLEPLLSLRVVARGRGVHYGIRRFPDPFPPGDDCWFGAQWVAVRRSDLDHLLDVDLAEGSPLRRLYRHSIIPDESALVTPLARRTPPAQMPPVTLQRWDDALDGGLTFTVQDLDEITASGSPFCRKVDPEASAELLDALDRRLAEGAAT
ncbi:MULTISPECIES: hypothetical protein [unclassified Microbacterium]|uniref:hypothetical protein n=1 Tax=unclassified Microbacterium TaxID=2609290 RepID=UPI0012F9116A|nr:hypothetical protein [Microbacterium sp. MAH-37]MVQ42631.1 hypothetical protein [Microbacterium sp. MAH-37]